ncbi:hypothetical protein GOBAR_DD08302 [Gossypium barbadense]|nr:hypothetical protein GOBAR_DD08302 [Gossypium barbadense]
MANTTATPMVFRPLMQVERKKRRNLRDTHNIKLKNHGKETLGLRFLVLHGLVDGDEENEENMLENMGNVAKLLKEHSIGGNGSTLLDPQNAEKRLGVLEPRKHNVATFKEKYATHNIGTSSDVSLEGGIQVKHGNKGRTTGGKFESNYNEKK